MIVAFEGPDRSGKTTLRDDVLRLIKEMNPGLQVLTYKLEEKPVDDTNVAFYQYKGVFDLAKQNPKALIIMDRSYLSELVYSGVKRDYDSLNSAKYVEFRIRKDLLVVYVKTDPSVIKQRIKTVGDDYITTDDVDPIVERYDDAIAMTAHSYLNIDGAGDRGLNAEEVVGTIIELMNK